MKQQWIGGSGLKASRDQFPVIDPATEHVFGEPA